MTTRKQSTQLPLFQQEEVAPCRRSASISRGERCGSDERLAQAQERGAGGRGRSDRMMTNELVHSAPTQLLKSHRQQRSSRMMRRRECEQREEEKRLKNRTIRKGCWTGVMVVLMRESRSCCCWLPPSRSLLPLTHPLITLPSSVASR